MAPLMNVPGNSWFEDFHVGEIYHSAGRTITEADLVNFAGLSGDFNAIHLDAEFSKTGPFGQRVAYGLLVMSIASGLTVQIGMLQGLQGGFREIEHWKFIRPVFIGDTVYVENEITETRSMQRAGGGLVKIDQRVVNQRQETVMKGRLVAFVLSKPSD